MSIQYGIWDELDGGFVETQLWTPGEAKTALDRLVADGGYEPEDLKVLEMCPDHDEQPRDTCEECAAEKPECSEHGDEPDEDCERCEIATAA